MSAVSGSVSVDLMARLGYARGPVRRWMKRQAAKVVRRLGHELLEDAPKRVPVPVLVRLIVLYSF